jgi:hypothetical protein
MEFLEPSKAFVNGIQDAVAERQADGKSREVGRCKRPPRDGSDDIMI